MISLNFGIIWRSVIKALADVKANTPPPVQAPMTEGDLLAALVSLETELPLVRSWIIANQGVTTGAVDILDALTLHGVTSAAKIKAALLALPGGIETAEEWLPTIVGFLSATQPAPTWPDQNKRRGQT